MKSGSRGHGLLNYQVSRWALGADFIWNSTVESEKMCRIFSKRYRGRVGTKTGEP
jgi:hypothetical protein